MARLTLDKTNKKILGVCAGLANWTGMDAMIIRLIFAVATVVGFGSPVLIYILLAMILDYFKLCRRHYLCRARQIDAIDLSR
jgi:phage shock protein C